MQRHGSGRDPAINTVCTDTSSERSYLNLVFTGHKLANTPSRGLHNQLQLQQCILAAQAADSLPTLLLASQLRPWWQYRLSISTLQHPTHCHMIVCNPQHCKGDRHLTRCTRSRTPQLNMPAPLLTTNICEHQLRGTTWLSSEESEGQIHSRRAVANTHFIISQLRL